MLDRAELKVLRDERGFRKAMNAGREWVGLSLNLHRTEDDGCYYEIEKHIFFTKDGKKDASYDLLEHGSCAWSSAAFDTYLKPVWERLIVDHKADDYFVDDWDAIEDWDPMIDEQIAKENGACSSPE